LNDKIIVTQANDDSCYIYDNDLKFRFAVKGQYLESLTKNYILTDYDNNYGVIDLNGKIILPNSFDKIFHFSNENLLMHLIKKGGGGRERYRGFKYNDSSYQWAYHTSLFVVVKRKKYGLYDIKGKELLPVVYDYIWDYNEKYLIVSKNNKWGFVDSLGNEIIPCEYEKIGEMSNSIFNSQISFNFTFERSYRVYYSQANYNESKGYSEGLIKVKKKKWGFIDETGKFIIKPIYDDTQMFSNGMAAIKRKDKWGFIDKTGKIVIKPKYDNVTSFEEEIAFFQEKNKWGIINKTGKIISKPKYELLMSYQSNPAIIKENKKYSFINEKGNISSIAYDSLDYFIGNIAWAKKGNKFGIINKNEEIILDFIYDDYFPFFMQPDGIILSRIHLNNKIGFVNNDGKIIIEPKYDGFKGWLKNGKIVAFKDGSASVIDTLGHTLVPYKYLRIEFLNNGLTEAQTYDSIFYYDSDFKLLISTRREVE